MSPKRGKMEQRERANHLLLPAQSLCHRANPPSLPPSILLLAGPFHLVTSVREMLYCFSTHCLTHLTTMDVGHHCGFPAPKTHGKFVFTLLSLSLSRIDLPLGRRTWKKHWDPSVDFCKLLTPYISSSREAMGWVAGASHFLGRLNSLLFPLFFGLGFLPISLLLHTSVFYL